MHTKRHQYIDAIRVVGMFCVVWLHASAEKLRMHIGSPGWHLVNALASLATIAVPLFFMISGAVVLSSRQTEDYRYVLKRRIPKLFLPLLAWSAVAILAEYWGAKTEFLMIAPADVVARAKTFFLSPVRVHFWFMYVLIPLYLVSPMLYSMVQNRRNLKYAVALFGLISALGSLLPLLPAAWTPFFNVTFIRGAAFGSYIYYFPLGYLLHTTKRRVDTRVLVAMAVIAWAAICLGTYWKSVGGGYYSEVFMSQTGVFALLLAAAVFLLIKNLADKPIRIVQVLAPLSFGVYLVHLILIVFWLACLPKIGMEITLTYVLLCFGITSALSCGIVWLLSQFRVTSYLFCGIRKQR